MIVLPVIVVCIESERKDKRAVENFDVFFFKCVWWQKSARYSGDQILTDTIQLYWIFLSKTSSIIIKRKLIELE